MNDCDGKPLKPYPVEPAVIGCAYCGNAFFVADEVYTDLGPAWQYNNVPDPITGWGGCPPCRNTVATVSTDPLKPERG